MEKKNFDKLAKEEDIKKATEALKRNNIEVYFVKNKEEAKKKIISLIPKNSEVMTMTSVTLEQIGIDKEINESGNYNSAKNKLNSLSKETDKQEMKRIANSPEYSIGSVHAVTKNGEILIASNSGSQLPAHSYGADKVIFVVGTQKIVENIDGGIKRIYEYCLPLESERAKKAYGVPGSFVSKILIFNRESTPNRISLIFVDEILGF